MITYKNWKRTYTKIACKLQGIQVRLPTIIKNHVTARGNRAVGEIKRKSRGVITGYRSTWK